MTSAPRAPYPVSAAEPDPRPDEALLQRAEALAAAVLNGQLGAALRGKNIGVLCEDPDSASATFFKSAATELGAHVACIRNTLGSHSSLAVVRETASMLSRLYDAVECLDVPLLLVDLMRESTDIPFFFGLSTDAHRTAGLAARMNDRSGLARRRVLQAALARAMAS